MEAAELGQMLVFLKHYQTVTSKNVNIHQFYIVENVSLKRLEGYIDVTLSWKEKQNNHYNRNVVKTTSLQHRGLVE